MKKLIVAAVVVGFVVYKIVQTINEMDDDITENYRPYVQQ
jgi:hypothetical protein